MSAFDTNLSKILQNYSTSTNSTELQNFISSHNLLNKYKVQIKSFDDFKKSTLDLLNNSNWISSKFTDGRTNSLLDESIICNHLQAMCILSGINHQKHQPRFWCDFSVTINNIYYPINVKTSTLKQADNSDCKTGLYYVLTGKMPNFKNEVPFPVWWENIKKDYKVDSTSDYYFLIGDKNNNQFYFTSLRKINELQPNGSNLPFQINWSKNLTPVNNSTEQLMKKVSNAIIKGMNSKINSLTKTKKEIEQTIKER